MQKSAGKASQADPINFRTHGKWILAGEHAVLRGGKALVFPVESRYLDVQYIQSDSPLSLKINHESSDLEMAFWGVLEKSMQSLGITRESLRGSLELTSDIPVGAGMGASATLCVSLAKWFTHLGFLEESAQYEFSKKLEDLFHGQSSGVDVAVALSRNPLIFQKPNKMEKFIPCWKPHFYLSYCGQRGVTADCIKKVQKLIEQKPEFAKEIDLNMEKAVEKALMAITNENEIDLLKESIDLSRDCFKQWGLISQTLSEHMLELKNAGAIATKPTGSGEGGFVLSLWREDPSQKDLATLSLIKA